MNKRTRARLSELHWWVCPECGVTYYDDRDPEAMFCPACAALRDTPSMQELLSRRPQ